jgi:hypothetical protein
MVLAENEDVLAAIRGEPCCVDFGSIAGDKTSSFHVTPAAM